MIEWKKTVLSLDAKMSDAVRSLEESRLQIALVVDPANMLKGTITDGDIRRGILRGETLDTPVLDIMKANPITAGPEVERKTVLKWMKQFQIGQVPIIDAKGFLIGLETLTALKGGRSEDNWVVIMAGGMGTRLRPLTENMPKPMIPVGGKPVLEGIIERLAEQGFHKIFLSVNYQAEKVESHFGDGSKWGVDITYLEEEQRLGTAGALSLLPQRPREPFLVMNADLMTDIDFRRLLDFHVEQAADATMGVREYCFQVPYGVIEMAGHQITTINEKPTQSYFVNGGIYALSPNVLSYVRKGQLHDMPDLFNEIIEDGGMSAAFPIHEYWIDIGQLDDLEKARDEFPAVFGKKRAS